MALRRVGNHNDRRLGEGRLQGRIRKMRNALKQREIGHDREEEAKQHDWLATDLIGEPTKQDEERSAYRERDRHQDLRGRGRDLQGLGQEQQSIELSAVPDHGFTCCSAEQSENCYLGVLPAAERFSERRL